MNVAQRNPSSGELFTIFRKRGVAAGAPAPSLDGETPAVVAPAPVIETPRGGRFELRLDGRQVVLVSIVALAAIAFSFLLGRKVGRADRVQGGASRPEMAGSDSSSNDYSTNPVGRPQDGPYTLRIARCGEAGSAAALRDYLVQERRWPAESVRVLAADGGHVVEVGSFLSPDEPRALRFQDGFAQMVYRGEKPFQESRLVPVGK